MKTPKSKERYKIQKLSIMLTQQHKQIDGNMSIKFGLTNEASLNVCEGGTNSPT